MTAAPSQDDSSELDAIIAGYLEAIERGEVVDREPFLKQHPAFSQELRVFFVDFDRLQLTKMQPGRDPDVTFVPQNEPKPGSVIAGRYKLLENIGEGGMGSVWVAEQKEPVKRRVAIKLIKAGMDSKQVLARFEAERQALALMDHPHIAKVLDAGTDEKGRPYFVMEYVKGKPITSYADKQQLSIPERLGLVEQVCQAVQHAHHKGVIHRDLKPSNILVSTVDGQPFAKVIDFGIAKAIGHQLTDKTIFTLHDQFVGTPQYMSPEQAEGSLDIDTRTDVYSLGVLLYELLTGSPPFSATELKHAVWEQLRKKVIEVDPPKPSTRLSESGEILATLATSRKTEPKRLGALVRGELDWIVMKALEKDRKRRYETPTSLANDLQSHLKGEPIQAAPPSTAYRLSKFVKRNKGPVFAAGTVVLTLLLGIGGTLWGMIKAEQSAKSERIERQKAVAAQEREIAARKVAERSDQIARDRASEFEKLSYRWGLQAAYDAVQEGHPDFAKSTLQSLPTKLRGWEWRWISAESDVSLKFVSFPKGYHTIGSSYNGRYICLSSKEENSLPIFILDAQSEKQTPVFGFPKASRIIEAAVSDNGERVAFLVTDEADESGSARLFLWPGQTSIDAEEWRSTSKSSEVTFKSSRGPHANVVGDGNCVQISTTGETVAVLAVLSEGIDSDAPIPNGAFVLSPQSTISGSFVPFHDVTPFLYWGMFPNGRTITFRSNSSGDAYVDLTANGAGSRKPAIPNEEFHVGYGGICGPFCSIDSVRSWSEPVRIYTPECQGKMTIKEDIGEFHRLYDGKIALTIKDHELKYHVVSDDGSIESDYSLGKVSAHIQRVGVDDVSRLVFLEQRDGVAVYPLLSDKEITWLAEMNHSNPLSPDGCSMYSGLTVRNARSGQITCSDFEGEFQSDGVWSPSGRRRLWITADKQIAVYDAPTAKLDIAPLPRSDNERSHVPVPESAIWSRDERRIAMTDGWSSFKGQQRWQQLFVVDLEPTIHVWDVSATGHGVQSFPLQTLLAVDEGMIHYHDGTRLFGAQIHPGTAWKCEEVMHCDAAAVSWDRSEIAIAAADRLSVYSFPEFQLHRTIDLPGQTYDVLWTQNDSSILIFSESRYYLFDSEDLVPLVSVPRNPENEMGSLDVPRHGDHFFLEFRLRSAVPFRERWPLIKSAVAEAHDPKNKDVAIAALAELIHDSAEINDVISRLKSSARLTEQQRSTAFQELKEAKSRLMQLSASQTWVDRNDAQSAVSQFAASEELAPHMVKLLELMAGSWPTPSASKLNQLAWELVIRGKLTAPAAEKALRAAEACVKQEPENAAFLNTLGVAQYRAGKYSEAIQTLEKSESLAEAEGESYESNILFIGMAHAQLGEFESAQREIQTVVDSGKELSSEDQSFLLEALDVQGLAALGLERPADAIAAWKQILAKVNGETGALRFKIAAVCEWYQLATDLAVIRQDSLTVAEAANTSTEAERCAKVCCFSENGDRDQLTRARQVIQRAIEREPNNIFVPYFRLSLGMAAYRLGDHAAALREFELSAPKLVAANSLNVTAVLYRAMALHQLGRSEEAQSWYSQATENMKPAPEPGENPLANNANADDIIMWLAAREGEKLLQKQP